MAIVLFSALSVFAGLSAQATAKPTPPFSTPPWAEPAKALWPYDKKLSALQADLLDLLDKLNCQDQFACIALVKDLAMTQQRIKTSLIIALMFYRGKEQGADLQGAYEIKMDYLETQFFLETYPKGTKTSLALVKNPLLAQLGLEGVRMMESAKGELEKLYVATGAPHSLF